MQQTSYIIPDLSTSLREERTEGRIPNFQTIDLGRQQRMSPTSQDRPNLYTKSIILCMGNPMYATLLDLNCFTHASPCQGKMTDVICQAQPKGVKYPARKDG